MLVLFAGCIAPGAGLDAPTLEQALLWSVTREIVVEVDHVEGRMPSDLAIDELETALTRATGKPVRIQGPSEIALAREPSDAYQWTQETLLAVERTSRDADTDGHVVGTAAYLHVLYLDGEYKENFGVNIGEVSFLFVDPIEDIGLPVKNGIGRDHMERAVLVHEVGHALGLVNDGIPMARPHEHPDDPHHSANPESVMRPGTDTYSGMLGMIGAGEPVPYEFDADDLADLAAFRASEPER